MFGQYNVSSSDKCVNFGVGQPSLNLLNLDLIKKNFNNFINNTNDNSVLQYGDILGYKNFRKDLSLYLNNIYKEKSNNNLIKQNNLFVTNGVTHAITLICEFVHFSHHFRLSAAFIGMSLIRVPL